MYASKGTEGEHIFMVRTENTNPVCIILVTYSRIHLPQFGDIWDNFAATFVFSCDRPTEQIFPSVNGFRLYMFCTNHLFSLLTTDSLLPPLYTSRHAAFWFCISTTSPTPLILWIYVSLRPKLFTFQSRNFYLFIYLLYFLFLTFRLHMVALKILFLDLLLVIKHQTLQPEIRSFKAHLTNVLCLNHEKKMPLQKRHTSG